MNDPEVLSWHAEPVNANGVPSFSPRLFERSENYLGTLSYQYFQPQRGYGRMDSFPFDSLAATALRLFARVTIHPR